MLLSNALVRHEIQSNEAAPDKHIICATETAADNLLREQARSISRADGAPEPPGWRAS
jgi:hypothetical protein